MIGKHIGCSFFALLSLAVASCAQDSTYTHINVIVRTAAEISDMQLAEAEEPARRIFQSAGISVHWLNCPRGTDASPLACQQPPSPADFVVHIIPRPLNASENAFGISFLDASGGVYADIFLDRVQRLRQEDSRISFASLLGSVMAHELGHLLLGQNSHSSTGLMQAHWQGEQLQKIGRGNLLFEPGQAAQLRARASILNARAASSLVATIGDH